MSEIESKVKAIIVDKLGVDEAEVKAEASFTMVFLFPTIRLRRSVLLATLSLTSRRTQNKFVHQHNGCFKIFTKQPLCFKLSLWN